MWVYQSIGLYVCFSLYVISKQSTSKNHVMRYSSVNCRLVAKKKKKKKKKTPQGPGGTKVTRFDMCRFIRSLSKK